MNVVAVVVVGSDGAEASEVFAPLGGEPLVVRSVRAVLRVERVDRVQLVVPARLVERVTEVCAELPVVVRGWISEQAHTGQRHTAALGDDPITGSFDGVIVVHDASRPLAPPELADAVIDAVLSGHAAAVPVLPLPDTVKLVDAGGVVQGTPDRATLRVVQTPQAFRADVARRVFPSVALDPTHGWSAVGSAVHTVPGHPLAFPVRGSWDLELAELLSEPGSTTGNR